LSDAAAKFPNLQTLDLSNFWLKAVHRDRLASFADIKILDLRQNNISRFDDADTFRDLRDLEYLVLTGNQLEKLPADIFRNNGKLRTLKLGENQLTELHVDQFKELVNLEGISLSHNQLEIIPAGLFRNNMKLTDIHLQSNKIRQMDFNLATHFAIKVLDFSGNVCIDEKCGSWANGSYCDAQTLSLIIDKIQKNC